MTESATLQCKGEALEAPSTEWFRLTGEGALDVRSDDRVIVTTDGEMIIQVGDLPCCQFKILTVLCKYWPADIVLNFRNNMTYQVSTEIHFQSTLVISTSVISRITAYLEEKILSLL